MQSKDTQKKKHINRKIKKCTKVITPPETINVYTKTQTNTKKIITHKILSYFFFIESIRCTEFNN